jgi:hypothetical protein
VKELAYLDVGCGSNTHEGAVNLDYLWHPGIDVCWDVLRGLPFPDQSMKGIFSEHCMEHLGPQDGLRLLGEFHRILRRSGILRLVVPDAELYLRTYVSQLDGDPGRCFPFQDQESRSPAWTPMHSVNRVFYQDRESLFGHRVMYDFPMLSAALMRSGFARVVRCEFGKGSDPALLLESPERRVESLYLEATKG